MTDIDYDAEAGAGIPFPGLNVTQTIDNGTETRLISTTDTGRILWAGWLLYLASLIFNYVFYKMHPSSPEMWTWGAAEELEEWTPQEEKKFETRKNTFRVRGQKNQLETLTELLPQEYEENKQLDDEDNV